MIKLFPEPNLCGKGGTVPEVQVSKNLLERFAGGEARIRRVLSRNIVHAKVDSAQFLKEAGKLLLRFVWCGKTEDEECWKRADLQEYEVDLSSFRAYTDDKGKVIQFYRPSDSMTITLYAPGRFGENIEQLLDIPRRD